MVPKISARNLVEAHGGFAWRGSAVAITVEHEKAIDFPASPFSKIAQVTDGKLCQPEIKIRHLGHLRAVRIALFDHHLSAAISPLRDHVYFK